MATLAFNVDGVAAPSRVRFTATIFVGSFLLFLVQPMIARLALPRLGGAPSVWNSAMLVYQALLLAGYAYAHWIGRLRPRMQAIVHLAALLLAAMTLPIGLIGSTPPPDANPFLWVPWLLLVSIGPLFFVVSAQAPLLQRWFAMTDGGDPYPLYAASNLGSFGGLITYPLFVEPLLPVDQQRWLWSGAYGLLVMLVAWCGLSIPKAIAPAQEQVVEQPRPDLRTMIQWIVYAAVPSGLILSTTLHITTDIIAMPLLWVLPLAAYLLSFSIAFSGRKNVIAAIIRFAPLFLLFDGLTLFMDMSVLALFFCAVSIVNLFTVSVALHSRLFDKRPAAQHLTFFYLGMSIGGVIGGAFCALVAPLIFNWTYEHLLLLVAAAWLIRSPSLFSKLGLSRSSNTRRFSFVALPLLIALVLFENGTFGTVHSQMVARTGVIAILTIAICAIGSPALFSAAVAALVIAAGAGERLEYSVTPGKMTRSFFGIYSIREGSNGSRMLVHGTTVHGVQNLGSPARERMETSYYAPPSGVGLAMQAASQLYGPGARIAVVGLGAGTLACYASVGQHWTFYEIDPAVVRIARDPARFTFLSRCKPEARIKVGDARLLIEREPKNSADVLVVDAFSSDAIPLHLLTREAFADYRRLLSPNGLLLVHISNRYIDLSPVVGGAAGIEGWSASIRRYRPTADALGRNEGPSDWVAMSASAKSLKYLVEGHHEQWDALIAPKGFVPWTDNYASVLPQIHWAGKKS